jgi:protocatechuate 3,4-dioxygenase beta subunit
VNQAVEVTMSRQGTCGAVIGFLAFGVAAFHADAQISPPPGTAAPGSQRAGSQSAGTGVIRGRVFDGDDGQPLRRALVRAIAPELRENRVAATDEQGRYELAELRAGHYTVTASKGNYVGLMFGQRRPFDAGKSLEITDGQTLDKVDFALPRGGVITGQVIDEYGDPVPNVQVAAMRSQFVQGRRRFMPAGRFATTDDLGEYRLFGLNPADYYVSATYRPPPANAADDDVPGYAITYFPGTVSTANAQRITVGTGRSLGDVNIALVPVKTAQVAGAAVNSKGQPMTNGYVSVMQRNSGLANDAGGAPLRPDGTFVIRNVAPGEYTLRAQSQFKQGDRPEIATAAVTLAGHDIEGVQLVVMPPSIASGVVLVDPAAAATVTASSIVLMVSAVDLTSNFMDTSARPKDDFTFESLMQPGTNIVRLLRVPDGMALKAVRIGGVDVTDTGFDVKPNENVRGIEVELTSHPTVVSGRVTDSSGAPSKDCTVVVFARDERKWEGASRYIGTARPDQDGKFQISGLPPGDYDVLAIDNIEPGQSGDPDVLTRIRDRAAAMSLGDGETKMLDLKLTTGS